MRNFVLILAAVCMLLFGSMSPAAAQATPASSSGGRTLSAIGYQVGSGTTVDLKAAMPNVQAFGEAKVEARQGVTQIEIKAQFMPQPGSLGTELITFVAWAVSPDGSASNVGELLVDKSGEGKLNATSRFQTFSLIITAEPYFAVTRPSEVVVLENAIRKNTKGKIFPITEYRLMQRTQYQKMGNPLALSMDLKNFTLDVYEARNSVEIAKSRAADKYAPEIFKKAESSLAMMENSLARKEDKRKVSSVARETVQFSEDARALSVKRQEEERIENERLAAAAKAKSEAEAKAAAEAAAAKRKADAEAAEAKRRADEEAKRQAELAAAREARLKAEADASALKAKMEADAAAAKAKAEADAAAAKAKAEADALKAKEEAAKAEAERARQAAEQLRAQLLDQFNKILETKDTPRGLVVTMADVLFDTGKYDLRPPTREHLARLSGIILAHPGLKLEIEGHTDSTGSDELNQKLSEQRANTVRAYLIQQGLAEGGVTAAGFGKTMPIADNSTAAGRQKNRRVEIIVSGDVIGTKIGR